jgi:hypothetical protein
VFGSLSASSIVVSNFRKHGNIDKGKNKVDCGITGAGAESVIVTTLLPMQLP